VCCSLFECTELFKKFWIIHAKWCAIWCFWLCIYFLNWWKQESWTHSNTGTFWRYLALQLINVSRPVDISDEVASSESNVSVRSPETWLATQLDVSPYPLVWECLGQESTQNNPKVRGGGRNHSFLWTGSSKIVKRNVCRNFRHVAPMIFSSKTCGLTIMSFQILVHTITRGCFPSNMGLSSDQ
jgi:hypothetical protein